MLGPADAAANRTGWGAKSGSEAAKMEMFSGKSVSEVEDEVECTRGYAGRTYKSEMFALESCRWADGRIAASSNKGREFAVWLAPKASGLRPAARTSAGEPCRFGGWMCG